MNLVIDYGNSAVKVGIFDHQNMIEKFTFKSEEEIQNFLQTHEAMHVMISSVKTNPEIIASWIKNTGRTFVLKPGLPLPANNLYKTPETLGVDRIAAVCGARSLYPLENALVIDAGTCITFDF